MENTLSKMCNLSNEKKKMDKARQATGSLVQIVEVTNEAQRCPQSYYMWFYYIRVKTLPFSFRQKGGNDAMNGSYCPWPLCCANKATWNQ